MAHGAQPLAIGSFAASEPFGRFASSGAGALSTSSMCGIPARLSHLGAVAGTGCSGAYVGLDASMCCNLDDVPEVFPTDDATDEPSDFGSLRPGTRLGRYELLVPIARGGMARV